MFDVQFEANNKLKYTRAYMIAIQYNNLPWNFRVVLKYMYRLQSVILNLNYLNYQTILIQRDLLFIIKNCKTSF